MANAAAFAEHNKSYVATFGDKKHLGLPTSKKAIVITCMDARINEFASLGIKEGDVHVIRNAGGRATDAIRSVVLSHQLFDSSEIIVYHHTECGVTTATEQQGRDAIKSKVPKSSWALVDSMALLVFSDVDKSIREDVGFLKEHPLITKDTTITGWKYDTKTGAVSQVI